MTIVKAYLIKGGTEEQRQCKLKQLKEDECLHMPGLYAQEKIPELGIIFSDAHDDFEGMALEKVRELAGTEELGPDFKTRTFTQPKRFGVITLSP